MGHETSVILSPPTLIDINDCSAEDTYLIQTILIVSYRFLGDQVEENVYISQWVGVNMSGHGMWTW